MSATHATPQVREQTETTRDSPAPVRSVRRPVPAWGLDINLYMRWLFVLGAGATYLLGATTLAPALLGGVIALFNAILYALRARRRYLPPLLIVAADYLFISLLIVLRGGATSEAYLLYALPIFYLGLCYGTAWTPVACVFTAGWYLATLYIGSGGDIARLQPTIALLGGHLIYFGCITIVVVGVLRHQARSRRNFEQLHARAREQVRRLEAISRITQQLNTAPTSNDIPRIIAEGTRDVIPFKNCRVHIIEQTPAGPRLPMVALYGPPIDGGMLMSGARQLQVGEGITGWVAQHGEPLLLANAADDPRALHVPGTPLTPNSLLAVPLCVGGAVKGVIALSQAGVGAFSSDDLQLMVTLANAAGIALTNIESRESLARQATTDAVTGLRHHGAFQAALAESLAAATRQGATLALVLFDIDGFRSYNERLGVAAGDEALRRVGRCLQQACAAAGGRLDETGAPQDACCFRIGGDEFALLLSGPLGPSEAAIQLARRTIQAAGAGDANDALGRISLSAGLAGFPADAATRHGLLDIAEAALYLVRQTGGNRLGLPDAAAKETLRLRRMVEEMVQASLAESGSPAAVRQLVAEAVEAGQHSRHAPLAQQLTTEALRALAAAIDAKDDYTRGHSERVAATAGEIGRWLDMGETAIEHLTSAARMHDIGKIGVPDGVLHKRGALTPLEQAIMATHPDIGADILAPIHTLREVVPIVRHHHEHFDGHGYPQGLAGAAIPLGARVVAVADALDAMITDRPYRRGMPITAALAELQKWAGSHYDPQVVAAVVTLYGSEGAGLALHGVLPLTDRPAVLPAATLALVANTPTLDLVMYPEPVELPVEFPMLHALMQDLADDAGE
ncbi:MAG: diguanylate cyclase [Chloroflexota bacterium]|nr:diguanylate cyclase [Chloroflexota bacterium]